MNTVFMNSENSKASGHYRLLLNLTDKIDIRRKDKYIYIYIYILLYQILVFTIHGKK